MSEVGLEKFVFKIKVLTWILCAFKVGRTGFLNKVLVPYYAVYGPLFSDPCLLP